MYEMKTWEEATKLKKSEIIRITLYILNAILDIVISIIEKNIAWIVCGVLWLVIAITEHSNLKIKKGNEEIIEYYRKNHKFESQIIIDMDYTLLDGYTSYLIAKNYNKGSVIVKLKRKSKKED